MSGERQDDLQRLSCEMIEELEWIAERLRVHRDSLGSNIVKHHVNQFRMRFAALAQEQGAQEEETK